MTKQEFMASMEKVFAVLPLTKNQEEAAQMSSYVAVLQESVQYMSAFDFEAVTKHLVNHMKGGRRPMPNEFHAAYFTIGKEREDSKRDRPQSESKEESIVRAVGMAKRLGPKGAQFAILMFEKHNRPVDPTVLACLVDRASTQEVPI